jgi:hypothetical protein
MLFCWYYNCDRFYHDVNYIDEYFNQIVSIKNAMTRSLKVAYRHHGVYAIKSTPFP